MAFSPGTTVGPYRLINSLGKGGMGEVYRAQDTRLGREVALKVLPDAFADDPERLSGLAREARVLASLNHPNIATLLGFTQIEQRSVLEMELVQGETLSERFARGPMPLNQALPVFKQIAQALEAAHERGIIHRDLKPSNVKILPDGRVKVLDFGLAKALEPEAVFEDVTQTPTVSASHAGVIVGTARYMSPEQVCAKPLDRRTDIWSFGCVFYEALAGRSPFTCATSAETLASILKDEPDWTAIAHAPAPVQALIRRCIRKDPQRRLRDIADARIEIGDLLDETAIRTSMVAGTSTRLSRQSRLTVAAIALAIVIPAVATGVWIALRVESPVRIPTVRVAIPLDNHQHLMSGPSLPFALAPDGGQIVYLAARPGAQAQLFLRALDRFDAVPIGGTEGASAPFFSPDGEWVGFYASDALRRVSLKGGAPLKICDTPPVAAATWAADDTILFGTTLPGDGLWRVPASGGPPQEITKPDATKGEQRHTHPRLLPDGRSAVFTIVTDAGAYGAVLTLKTHAWHALPQTHTTGGSVQFVAPGHLVYAQAGALVASAFNTRTGEPYGPPLPMLERVETSEDGTAYFDVSETGALVYIARRSSMPQRALVVVDRTGRAAPLSDLHAAYAQPRFSHDGRFVVVAVDAETGSDVWVHDVQRRTRTRLTNLGACRFPVWTADSRQVTYQVSRTRAWTLFMQAGDGSGPPEPVLTTPIARPIAASQSSVRLLPGTLPTLSGANPQYPASWSSDGRTLAFVEKKPSGERDIWMLERGSEPTPFAMTPFDEWSPTFSPDGRFLAYVSNESGTNEVYVQPFPGPGPKYLISTDGGVEPAWAPDGRELFYRRGNQFMAVAIQSGSTFAASPPHALFEGRYDLSELDRNYDISADGQRFVMIRSEEPEPAPPLHLVLRWAEDLKTRAQRR